LASCFRGEPPPPPPEALLAYLDSDQAEVVQVSPGLVYFRVSSALRPWAVHLLRMELGRCELGLRVLEARARLGIAVGGLYPQLQQAQGGATYVAASKSVANTAGGDLRYWEYDIGASLSWELDFWGRFRRGIESADADLLASVAAYDDVVVLLTAQVASTYNALREAEEQLRVARDNVEIQRRSVEITEVRFEQGDVDQLDVEQAKAQLYSTQATIPSLEVAMEQARNALSTLLGRPPGDLAAFVGGTPGTIPKPPSAIAVGVPADLLRRRPDVRQAELQAAAQSALIGVAEADLYPSFGLSGSLGLLRPMSVPPASEHPQ